MLNIMLLFCSDMFVNIRKGFKLKRVTTKSGAVYYVDPVYKTWKKNNGRWDRLKEMFCVALNDVHKLKTGEAFEKLDLQPGTRLYIAGLEHFWLSTEVTDVEAINAVDAFDLV